MTKARDLANIISGGFTEADIPNLTASKITSGTFADARIAASNVSQHATSYIEWQSVVTASTLNAVAGKGYPINTTSNTCTITLPANPSVGDTIKFVDYARKFSTNKIIINQNSKNFQGNTSPNPEYNTSGQSITCTYIDTTQGWIPTVDDDVTLETPQSYSADFLVVAGGGGSGGDRGGGGGAGGYRASYNSEASGGGGSSESSLTLNAGVVYTITVGQGGALSSNTSVAATNGGNSSISGSDITDIVSIGGGRGAVRSENNGSAGGSGGGASNDNSATGGAGTANQGFAGGANSSNDAGVAGGGGGAGAVGFQGAGNSTNRGQGGVGVASTITGSSVTRAGGGGGAGTSAGGAGGTGGGGAGSTSNGNGTAGTANTGGGAGAGGNGGTTTGAAGGSGVVILRMATASYSGTTTGSPSVSQSGSDTILIFNGDGSYTG